MKVEDKHSVVERQPLRISEAQVNSLTEPILRAPQHRRRCIDTSYVAVRCDIPFELSSCATWMAAGAWPRSVVSTGNRLVRLGEASRAREKGQSLYCWHGPSVPQFVVVAGQGPYPGKP